MITKGFYWVVYFGEWTIAEHFGSGYWSMIGDELSYTEDEFDEIGDKIERNIA